MHPIRHGLLLAALVLPLAAPGLAEARAGRPPSTGRSEHVALSAPDPKEMLADAEAGLQAGDVARSTADIEMAQDRLLHESLAVNLPAGIDRAALRDAIPVLDRARQALIRGDTPAAGAAIAQARAML